MTFPDASLRLVAPFVVALTLLIAPPTAKSADAVMVDGAVDVECQPQAGRVLVKPAPPGIDLAQVREAPGHPLPGSVGPQSFRVGAGGAAGDCWLKKGTPVRVRVTQGRRIPGGRCEDEVPVRVSIWVGRRRWLDLEPVGVHCAIAPPSHFVVTANGLERCEAERGETPLPGADEEIDCVFHPAATLATRVDAVEFPAEPASKKPARDG